MFGIVDKEKRLDNFSGPFLQICRMEFLIVPSDFHRCGPAKHRAHNAVEKDG